MEGGTGGERIRPINNQRHKPHVGNPQARQQFGKKEILPFPSTPPFPTQFVLRRSRARLIETTEFRHWKNRRKKNQVFPLPFHELPLTLLFCLEWLSDEKKHLWLGVGGQTYARGFTCAAGEERKKQKSKWAERTILQNEFGGIKCSSSSIQVEVMLRSMSKGSSERIRKKSFLFLFYVRLRWRAPHNFLLLRHQAGFSFFW